MFRNTVRLDIFLPVNLPSALGVTRSVPADTKRGKIKLLNKGLDLDYSLFFNTHSKQNT